MPNPSALSVLQSTETFMIPTSPIRLFDPEENPLGTKGLGGLAGDLAVGGRSAELFGELALRQPFASLPIMDAEFIPDIQRHGRAVGQHARFYLDSIEPEVLAVFTDVRAFANRVVSTCEVVTELLDTTTGDARRRAAVSLLNQLDSRARDTGKAALALTDDVRTFAGQIDRDRKNLSSDVADAEAAVLDGNSRLSMLNADVEAALADSRAASHGLAAAIAGDLTASAVIFLGTVGELDLGVLVTGVVGAVSSTGAILAEGEALIAANNRLRDAYAALREADVRIALLRAVEFEAEGLSEALDQMGTGLCSMAAAWQRISTGIGDFREALRTGSDDALVALKNVLSTAAMDWADVGEQAQDLIGTRPSYRSATNATTTSTASTSSTTTEDLPS